MNTKIILLTIYGMLSLAIVSPLGLMSIAKAQDLVVPTDEDILFYVNGNAELGFIYKDSLDSIKLEDLPFGGSYACAYDPDNERVYIHQGMQSPYGIYYYDLQLGTFHYAGDAPDINGGIPWMEYSIEDKVLLVGSANELMVIDPSTTDKIGEIPLAGFSGSKGGGDLAFSTSGDLYVTPNSGLYYYDQAASTSNNVERRSAESLPFYLTSMAIDDDDIVWLATSDTNSKLMNMDTVTGDYIVRHIYDHKINDLSDRPGNPPEVPIDSDGDGVTDDQDEYPNDPEACGAIFTPSELGTGTLAYEDLWPRIGDFDFNDLVISYRFTKYTCLDNKTIKMKMRFAITAIGASFRNGFGIELPISKDLIESVSGVNISRNLVTLDEKNLEEGHSNAVIIVFDNAYDNMGASNSFMTRTKSNQVEVPIKEIEVEIRFTEFIDNNLLSGAPYNPFIFVNKSRGREVHLPGKQPTSLATSSLFGTHDDRSDIGSSDTYKNENGLPWAINISHKFRVPNERQRIDLAYLNFINFATNQSGDFSSWYSDAPGNRDTNYIYIPTDDPSMFID